MCDLEAIGVSSIFSVIRSVAILNEDVDNFRFELLGERHTEVVEPVTGRLWKLNS